MRTDTLTRRDEMAEYLKAFTHPSTKQAKDAAWEGVMAIATEAERYDEPTRKARAEAEGSLDCTPTAMWSASFYMDVLMSKRKTSAEFKPQAIEYLERLASYLDQVEKGAPCAN